MADLDDSIVEQMLLLSGMPKEHIGLIYHDGEAFKATATKSTGQQAHTKGYLSIPKGTKLSALFHNHPVVKGNRELKDSGGGEAFSDDDKATSKRLGVPSYILTPSGRVLKFDPSTGETSEVLSQLPVRSSGAHNVLAN